MADHDEPTIFQRSGEVGVIVVLCRFQPGVAWIAVWNDVIDVRLVAESFAFGAAFAAGEAFGMLSANISGRISMSQPVHR